MFLWGSWSYWGIFFFLCSCSEMVAGLQLLEGLTGLDIQDGWQLMLAVSRGCHWSTSVWPLHVA